MRVTGMKCHDVAGAVHDMLVKTEDERVDERYGNDERDESDRHHETPSICSPEARHAAGSHFA
jgi:hypothetical protein